MNVNPWKDIQKSSMHITKWVKPTRKGYKHMIPGIGHSEKVKTMEQGPGDNTMVLGHHMC